jgi:DNA-binding FadR family transcriptional regulator
MEHFRVSRATVREALRVAESLGLIEVRPGERDGPLVLGAPWRALGRALMSLVKIDEDAIVDLIELRMLIEGEAVFRVAGLPRSRLRPLDAAFRRMEETLPLELFAQADADFHVLTVNMTGNSALLLIEKALHEPTVEMVTRRLRSEVEGEEDLSRARGRTLARHGRLLELMRSGDALRARAYSNYSTYINYKDALSKEARARLETLVVSCGDIAFRELEADEDDLERS